MAYLQRLWASIEDKSQQSPAPALIYREQDLVIRSIRDYFTPIFRKFWSMTARSITARGTSSRR